MARIGSIFLDLKLESASLKTELEKTRKHLGKNVGQMNASMNTLSKAANAVRFAFAAVGVAITAAIGSEIVSKVIETIHAYAEAEKQVTALNSALQATGRFSEEGSAKIKASAEALQKLTVFDDDSIVGATATLAKFSKSLNTEELAKAQTAIIGLSDKLGIDLNSSAMLVGKSVEGSRNMLSRYGIEVDKTASASEKLDQITTQLNSNFETAVLSAQSLEGQQTQLKNAYGDLQETIGGTIVKITEGVSVVGNLKNAIVALEEWIKKNQAGIIDLGKALGNLIGASANMALQLVKLNPLFHGIATAVEDFFKQANRNGELKTLADALNSIAKAFNGVASWAEKSSREIDKNIQAVQKFLNISNPLKNQKSRTPTTVAPFPGIVGFAGGAAGLPGERSTLSFGKLPDLQDFITKGTTGLNRLSETAAEFGRIFENSLIGSFRDGKFEFKNMLNSILSGLAELTFRLTVVAPLTKALSGGGQGGGGSFLGSLAGGFLSKIPKLFGFADGGLIPAMRPSIVGERGPELFLPGRTGTIVPNEMLGGSGVTLNQYFTINAIDSRSFEDRLAEHGRFIGNVSVRAVQQAENRMGRRGPMDGGRGRR